MLRLKYMLFQCWSLLFSLDRMTSAVYMKSVRLFLLIVAYNVLEKTVIVNLWLCSSFGHIQPFGHWQHKVPVQLHHQYSMLLLYLFLQYKNPGFSLGFFLAFELHECFKQKQQHQLNCIENHGTLVYHCTDLLLTSQWKQVCFCSRRWLRLHLWCIPQHLSRSYLKSNCNSCNLACVSLKS